LLHKNLKHDKESHYKRGKVPLRKYLLTFMGRFTGHWGLWQSCAARWGWKYIGQVSDNITRSAPYIGYKQM